MTNTSDGSRGLIHVDRVSKRARDILAEAEQYELTDYPMQAELLWLRKNYRAMYGQLGPQQILNHIPGEGSMSRKGDLTSLLNGRPAMNGVTAADFYPESYNLSDAVQRQAFLNNC